MHGGSGLSDQDFKRVIEAGISKVNIFTDINVTSVKAALEHGKNINLGITEVIPAQVEAIKQAVVKKMQLFGSTV